MKKVLIVLLAVSLLAACNNQNKDFESLPSESVSYESDNEYTSAPDPVGLEESSTENTDISVNNTSGKRSFYGENTGTDTACFGAGSGNLVCINGVGGISIRMSQFVCGRDRVDTACN